MPDVLGYLKETPSQTAGPYVHIGATPNAAGIAGVWAEDLGARLVGDETLGERLVIEGRIFDGSGQVVRDAIVEIWQADAAGLYNSPLEPRGKADPAFAGWGRAQVDEADGFFRFSTIKPGATPFPDGRLQAPHVTLWIAARGVNLALHTRAYFSDEPDLNASDPLLCRIPDPDRRASLIAVRSERAGETVFTFDIRLQGEGETIFLDM